MKLFVGIEISGGVMLYTGKKQYDFDEYNPKFTYTKPLDVTCSLQEVVAQKEHYIAIYPHLKLEGYCGSDVTNETPLN